MSASAAHVLDLFRALHRRKPDLRLGAVMDAALGRSGVDPKARWSRLTPDDLDAVAELLDERLAVIAILDSLPDDQRDAERLKVLAQEYERVKLRVGAE